MRLTLSPMRRDDTLVLSRAGDTLTLNGQVMDLSGATPSTPLPCDSLDCPWIVSDVTRVEGQICLSIILPHGPAAAPGVLYPEPIVLADADTITLNP